MGQNLGTDFSNILWQSSIFGASSQDAILIRGGTQCLSEAKLARFSPPVLHRSCLAQPQPLRLFLRGGFFRGLEAGVLFLRSPPRRRGVRGRRLRKRGRLRRAVSSWRNWAKS